MGYLISIVALCGVVWQLWAAFPETSRIEREACAGKVVL